MEIFEKKSTENDFLRSLLELQRTIEEWYNNRELYHIILFSCIYASDATNNTEPKLSFFELYKRWRSESRRKFIDCLKRRISNSNVFSKLVQQKDFSDAEHEEEAHKENWWDKSLIRVTTLLDIIHLLKSTQKNVVLPPIYFRAYKEDIEHIFPQTPIGDKVKDKSKQTQILKQYIEIINNQLSTNSAKVEIADSEINWDDSIWKENTKNLINEKLKEILPINSLGNMCLLHESVNRGYGNDFFLEKRIDIMRKSQEGYYIRPHVYEAFNKNYAERQESIIDMNLMLRWEKSDIIARRKSIIKQICEFLIISHE